MGAMNKAILLGNLGRDPELRQAGDRPVANFTVATTKRWRDKKGAQQERTEWHRIVAWGPLGETCAEHLKTGSEVLVEGEIQTREWQDKEGQKRFTTEINAANVQFLKSGERRSGNTQRQQPTTTPEEDDLPF